MSTFACYICREDTGKNKNVFNQLNIEICSKCEEDLINVPKRLPNFEEKSSIIIGSNLRCSVSDKIRRNLIEFARRIENDETIIDYVVDISSKPLTSNESGMIILTDKRIVAFAFSTASKTAIRYRDIKLYEYNCLLKDIINIESKTETFGTKLIISDKGNTYGNSSITNMNRYIMNDFALSVNKQKSLLSNSENTISNTTQIINQSDNLDKLKKLKELFDLGVINQEEFDNKKKQLLDNL
jgi:hypothetical protein